LGYSGSDRLSYLRGGLKPKPKKKNPFKKQVKKIIKAVANRSKLLRNINSKTNKQTWYDSIPKSILPSRLDIYDSHIEFERMALARSLILGKPHGSMPNYPPDLTANTFTKIMALGGRKGCKFMLSTAISKKPALIVEKELQNAWTDAAIEEEKARLNNPAGVSDLGIEKHQRDIRERHDDLWDRNENAFNTQTILTIKGNEDEVLTAESHVLSLLASERIGNSIPEHLQLEAFLAATPTPDIDYRFLVEVPSSIAAKLATMTNINTRYDPYGLLFGKNRLTNVDVIKDLRKLPAKHLIMYGATGSGKTFTAMLLLMRLKDILNYRIVYISRKAPDRKVGAVTDFEAVSNYYGEDAEIIILGTKGYTLNPLQIIYDEKTMNEADYDDVWDNHRIGISEFFKQWFKGEFSPNMESVLEDALDKVYNDAKIYRDKPETWKKKFPTIEDLRKKWLILMQDKNGEMFEDRRAAGALYRKTRNAKPGGSMAYLLGDTEGKTNFDFSKDWITVDLHKVDKRIRDALYVLITSALSIRFNSDPNRETVIFVDEARAFLRNPEVCNFLLDALTMGRSQGVALWLATQQPADIKKADVEEEFSTNMFMAIMMGHKLKPKTAGYVQKYFGLSSSTIEDLITCDQGEGILLVDDEITPIRFEPCEEEKAIIQNKFKLEKPAPICGYRLKSVYLTKDIKGENFIERNKVFTKEMLEEGDENAIIANGWLKWPVQQVTKKGPTVMFYRPGDIDTDKKHMSIKGLGKMTIDHYASVIQMEAHVLEEGFKAHSNHTGGIDLEFEKTYPDGKTRIYGAEYEEAESHSKEDLNKKWGRLLKYDAGKIFCSAADFKIVSSGMPSHSVEVRGQNFVKWIEYLKEKTATAYYSESIVKGKKKESDLKNNDQEADTEKGENPEFNKNESLEEKSEIGLNPEIQPITASYEE
jgi:AAA-like domain